MSLEELWERASARRELLPPGGWRIDCMACSAPLANTVFDGRYCGPSCAGVSDSELTALAAWGLKEGRRCLCYSRRSGRKKPYLDTAEAEADRLSLTERTGRDFDVYRCGFGYWHVGSRARRTPSEA